MTTIHASKGQKRFIGGTITETASKNIQGDSVVVGFGTYTEPPTSTPGIAPTVIEQGKTTADLVVKLLVDNTTAPIVGAYLWGWITDASEVEPVRLQGPITID